MKAAYIIDNSILTIEFTLEKQYGDRDIYKVGNRIIKLNRNKVFFILPNSFKFEELHNDLLGLVIILLIYPYVGKKLTLSFEISTHLANSFSKCGKILLPVNPNIQPRQVKKQLSYPSIAFSAGCDSTAALLMMPKNTKVCFLDRIIPINKKSMYCKDCIYFTLDSIIDSDYHVNVIQSDMEYLRDPVGFPIDIACGIPNILLADMLKLDSVAYGYANHHKEFLNNQIDYVCTGTFKLYRCHDDVDKTYQFWNDLYQSVDLFINLPIMGITEITTQYIVQSSRFSKIVQSCMRGKIGRECGKCLKCFKTGIVAHIYNNGSINYDELSRRLSLIENEIKSKYNYSLNQIHKILTLESIFLFIMNYYRDERRHEIIDLFELEFMDFTEKGLITRWNQTSNDFIVPEYREEITQNLKKITNLEKI